MLAVPVAALLAYWAFARLDLYMGAVLALVPLSINLGELGLTSVGWYMPTEPMLFALLLLSCARWLSGERLDRTLWKHPVTWVILAGFVWMGLTILPSSHPVVSLKAWISRAWFMVAFYFLLAAWFQHSPKAKPVLGLLLVPMCIVVTYTIVRHAGHGLARAATGS